MQRAAAILVCHCCRVNDNLEKKWNNKKRGLKTQSTQSPCPCRVHEEMLRRLARIQGTWCIQAIDRVSGFSHACGVPLRRLSLGGSIKLDDQSDVFPYAAVITCVLLVVDDRAVETHVGG
jgi:hypothetical protein